MINPIYVKVHTRNEDFELIVDYHLENERFELMRYQSFYHPVVQQFNQQKLEDYESFPNILIRQKRLHQSIDSQEMIDWLMQNS